MFYRCPRTDLDCDAQFESTGDLDHHFRWTHGYRRSSRYLAVFRPLLLAPVPLGQLADQLTGPQAKTSPQVEARTTAGARPAATAGAGPAGFGPAATAGAVRARGGEREHAGVAAAAGRALRRLRRHRGSE